MKVVPKLRKFAIYDFEHCGMMFGSIVMTAKTLRESTPHLTKLTLGSRWYITDKPSPDNMELRHELPDLDPDIFKQITHLKLKRFVWGNEELSDDPDERDKDDSVSRGIRVEQLQYLKVFHIRRCAEVTYDGLRGFEQLTALEELVIDGEILWKPYEDDEDGVHDLDLSPLVKLPNLRVVKVSLPIDQASKQALTEDGRCRVENL